MWLNPISQTSRSTVAYLAVRPALDGAGIEFGTRAYGAHGEAASTAMVEQIQAWDRQAGPQRPGPHVRLLADQHRPLQINEGTAVLEKTHGLITISWPTAS